MLSASLKEDRQYGIIQKPQSLGYDFYVNATFYHSGCSLAEKGHAYKDVYFIAV